MTAQLALFQNAAAGTPDDRLEIFQSSPATPFVSPAIHRVSTSPGDRAPDWRWDRRIWAPFSCLVVWRTVLGWRVGDWVRDRGGAA